jgi:hypothetical protein
VRRAAAEQLLQRRLAHSIAGGLASAPLLPDMLAAAAAAVRPAAAAAASRDAAAPLAAATSDSSSSSSSSSSSRVSAAPAIRVLCRTPAQVQAALAVPWLDQVVLDFLEVHGLKEAVAAVQGAGKQVRQALACGRV